MSAILAGEAALEVDNTPFSDYESDGGSELSTQSLTSSIREHVYENGRRYHRKSAGQYYMPSDEAEQDRLDLAHHLFTSLFGGDLYKAPIGDKEDPANVLDAGTGTGVWALDFGDLHPGSQVIGLDLAPIQPEWTFPNVKFECDDLEKEWTYKPNYFQYIHSRCLSTSIKDWKRYLRQCFKHTAPGGYLEVVEHSLNHLYCDDDTLEGSALKKYITTFGECLAKAGIYADLNSEYLKASLEEAGFTNVKIYATKLPWGSWPKDRAAKRIGAINHLQLQSGLEAHALMVCTQFGGMTAEEARALCHDALKEVDNRSVHAYNYIWNVVGQKPV
ncbi:S-adenosyl-L-methionine-dependent methyltransferase [Ascodesmis nigricans]|uniref:S-adenosyl-L-methionine-dependent methyltransferase n=1 Tax=Ascodesmis nigricans TaxID=341454 RepID=A0A4S2MRX8_9PEZI|nr:S-adenosyl-L-methionine-dependent methyltransferase [Ascodesmis nigricans]